MVIVAAGAGRRMGGGVRKQYLEVAGKPLLLHAVRAFAGHPSVRHLVVVLPSEDAEAPPAWLAGLGARIVTGGVERSDSVWNGLCALHPDADPVLIHDGARPFVSGAVIDRVLEAARAGTGAVAAVRAVDTLKEVDSAGRVARTLDRTRYWHAQTPQGFPRCMIVAAHQHARAHGVRATDDAALCEVLGETVVVVEGSPENLKVTHAADLAVAEAIARRKP